MAEALVFTPEQRAAYKQYAPHATDEQYSLFLTECERRRLIPGVHVVFQLRKVREYSYAHKAQIDVDKVTLITTINALRLIAERTGKFRGYGKFTYYYVDEKGLPTVESNIPYGKVPHAVGVELFRDGWQQPVFAVARYEAYVQTKQDGGKDVPTRMWRLRGEEQLAKCAEAAGLRMVAPEECGDIYIAEEFERDNKEQDAAQPPQTTAPVVVPTATVAPPVNQEPARIETSPFSEVAIASAKAVEAQAATPAPAPVSKPAAAPAPATPRPAPVARPIAPPVAKVAPPATPKPATSPIPNRVPQVDGPAEESPAELAELADRIERDKTPAKPFVATDADLPEVLQPTQIHISEQPPAPSVAEVKAAIATVAAAQSATVSQAVGTGDDAPATPTEYQNFVTNRAAKIVRDKLEKSGLKNAGVFVKDYLLKQSGKAKLQHISAGTFERLISALETATAEDAVKLVKG